MTEQLYAAPWVLCTEHRVCAVPRSVPSWQAWSLKVVWRSENRWAVADGFGRCLSRDGEWSWESSPSERTEEWIAEHRFDLDTAMALAISACEHVEVNGFTPEQEVARHVARGN